MGKPPSHDMDNPPLTGIDLGVTRHAGLEEQAWVVEPGADLGRPGKNQ